MLDMMRGTWRGPLAVLACIVLLPGTPAANDHDGGNDCLRPTEDWGSAPEGITAYVGMGRSIVGHFPTCSAPGDPGTDENDPRCPARSTPQSGRPTGYVRHLQQGSRNYWLGCYADATGPHGIDSEPDGQTVFGFWPLNGVSSACDPAVHVDNTEGIFFPWGWGVDDVPGDGSDSMFGSGEGFSPTTCRESTLPIRAWNCGDARQVFLNICIDMNSDGDWNDSFHCSDGCAYEWAVKNAPLLLPPGCSSQSSPPFLVGPQGVDSWFRLTISDTAAPDDFPWNGSAGLSGGALVGGETEDTPTHIVALADGARRVRWGALKQHYR